MTCLQNHPSLEGFQKAIGQALKVKLPYLNRERPATPSALISALERRSVKVTEASDLALAKKEKEDLDENEKYFTQKVTDQSSSLLIAQSPKIACVLLLWAFSKDPSRPGPFLLFLKRSELLKTHKGEIAFPGGQQDPSDLNSFAQTALRETEEEIGVRRDQICIQGDLPPLKTVTRYLVYPLVATLQVFLEDCTLNINSGEVAEVFWVSLQDLMNPSHYQEEKMRLQEVDYPIDVYRVAGHRIWGATGSITKNLLDRLSSLS